VKLFSRLPRVKKKWRWPSLMLDLSLPKHRRNLLLVLLGLFVLGSGLAVGGAQGYSYTESSEFCGTVCHSMSPQWTRYQRSPHGNVLCADCHIGPGATFFVKSKIDGLRQVYAETFDTYHRPIKSPIYNLRPAREVCETCHTPTNFKDNIVKVIHHFDSDQQNTPITNTLILKMGGYQENTGHSQGIHWHISSKIYYIPADYQRQVMLWVGVEQPDGSLKEYFSRDLIGMGQTDFVAQARAAGKVREMDCIDCHNRTAHYIPTPEESVDRAMADGIISRDLPFIRKRAVELLRTPYSNKQEAYAAIVKLGDEYKTTAGIALIALSDSSNKIQQAVDELKRIYDATVFPDMNLNWQTNPNNARHTPTVGCFRCHDGNHVLADTANSSSGETTISVKCNLCHSVPITGRGKEVLIEAPVIVGAPPASHADFRWTIEHRSVTEADKQECYQCHGQGFCNNGACHNLSHPEDMAFTHANEIKQVGQQVCYTCHQNVTCTRCHTGGILKQP